MIPTKDTDFVKALGKVSSGLFIVTTAFEDKMAGYLASFVQQASFSPLIFSIACHPDRYLYQLMQKSKKFALNIIPEGDKILMQTFAKGHGPDENPFATIAHENFSGVPLLKDAIGGAVFDITSETKPGDHIIIFGTARDGAFYNEQAKPWVHIRKSALSY